MQIVDYEELSFWLKSLSEKDLIIYSGHLGHSSPDICLTADGWANIKILNKNTGQAFIAMAFTDDNGDPLQNFSTRNAIIEVCGSLGYNAKIVDEVEYNEGVMDKVISLINNSSFVIADLTRQKNGVYYEAGYAYGKNIPVIHIVSAVEGAKKCHFDVSHLNLIIYKSDEDLCERLKNRIEKTVGIFS